MKSLILASSSPRRRELLEKCGVPFQVEAADIDEHINLNGYLPEEIRLLARRKAQAVLAKHPEAVILGSDTIVALGGRVLGKPKDEIDAENMLRSLSGHTHQVITGVCLLSCAREYTNVSISEVSFSYLSEEEIRKYVETGEPMDKAGAYAIQGIASRYVTGIHGDYYAIMGLPVAMVYEELKHLPEY